MKVANVLYERLPITSKRNVSEYKINQSSRCTFVYVFISILKPIIKIIHHILNNSAYIYTCEKYDQITYYHNHSHYHYRHDVFSKKKTSSIPEC